MSYLLEQVTTSKTQCISLYIQNSFIESKSNNLPSCTFIRYGQMLIESIQILFSHLRMQKFDKLILHLILYDDQFRIHCMRDIKSCFHRAHIPIDIDDDKDNNLELMQSTFVIIIPYTSIVSNLHDMTCDETELVYSRALSYGVFPLIVTNNMYFDDITRVNSQINEQSSIKLKRFRRRVYINV